MPELISVIVPVYNVAQYLPRCMNSILNNTYKNLQVICINDGSTDNSLEILEEFANRDNRITVVNQQNKGLAEARNAGLSFAKGDYVSFVDSDDWLHSRFFEVLLFLCKNNNTSIAMCHWMQTELLSVEESEINLADLPVQIVRGDDVVTNGHTRTGYVWNCLFRRECVEGIRFPNMKVEDKPYKILVLAKGKGNISIAYTAAQLYYYFQRSDSLARFLNAESRLASYEYLFDYYDHETDPSIKRLILLYLSKTLLVFRYNLMYEFSHSGRRRMERIAKRCSFELFCCESINLRYKIIHRTLLCHPTIYRLYRIIDDPSMLKYEKQMKHGNVQPWNQFKSAKRK